MNADAPRRRAPRAVGAGLLLALAIGSPAHAGAASAQEWPLDAQHFDAQRLWTLSKGAGVVVAVIDTGIDAEHPDLTGRVLPGADFTGTAANGQVDTSADSHGTSVAGVIAADAASGRSADMAGLAPQASLLPIRVTAGGAVQPALVAQGISYAATHGARVINISLGTSIDNPEIRDAIGYAVSHDIVVVAAAGNESASGNPVQYPAALPGVVAVAGSTRGGTPWSGSESGPYIALAAPAESIYSTSDLGGYVTEAGTSYSAPYVSAVAALLRAKYPDESAGQIISRMIQTADNPAGPHSRDNKLGYGIVDPYKALTAPTPTATENPLLSAKSPAGNSNAAEKSSDTGLIAALAGGGLLIAAGIVAALWWLSRRKTARAQPSAVRGTGRGAGAKSASKPGSGRTPAQRRGKR